MGILDIPVPRLMVMTAMETETAYHADLTEPMVNLLHKA